jgi:hypothetical protein
VGDSQQGSQTATETRAKEGKSNTFLIAMPSQIPLRDIYLQAVLHSTHTAILVTGVCLAAGIELKAD